MRALGGVRVLDFGGFITGPLAAMILGELGADVIKVERPGEGDPFRSFQGGQDSPHFIAHNRNKRSITLDYARPDGLSVLFKLLETTDVAVMNSRPGVAEKLGIGYERLKDRYPRLIWCAITGFGADGPYAQRPAFDNVGQALSGWMSRHRASDEARVIGPAISDPATSYYAAMGILSALYEREKSGRGHKVEVNMLEATIALGLEPLAYHLEMGEPAPLYARGANSQAYNLTCKDGRRIGLHMSSPDKFFAGLCRAVGKEEWIAKYRTRRERIQGYDELARDLSRLFREKPRAQWMKLLEANDVPFAPELGVDELEADPQVRHLGTFYEVAHPKRGNVKAQHRPLRIDGSREIDFRAPPMLGEHTEEVLAEAGFSAQEIQALRGKCIL